MACPPGRSLRDATFGRQSPGPKQGLWGEGEQPGDGISPIPGSSGHSAGGTEKPGAGQSGAQHPESPAGLQIQVPALPQGPVSPLLPTVSPHRPAAHKPGSHVPAGPSLGLMRSFSAFQPGTLQPVLAREFGYFTGMFGKNKKHSICKRWELNEGPALLSPRV